MRYAEERFCSHSWKNNQKNCGLDILIWKSNSFLLNITICGGHSSLIGRIVLLGILAVGHGGYKFCSGIR